MATEYLKNGDFSDKLEHWKAPVGFEPDFKPMPMGGGGQSIKLNTGVTVSQSVTELPGTRLHLEFGVHSAKLFDAFFVVVVGGYNAEGTMNLTQVVSLATDEWVYYSGDFDFQEKLKDCFLTMSAPADTSSFSRSGRTSASMFGPVRFANFSLTLAD